MKQLRTYIFSLFILAFALSSAYAETAKVIMRESAIRENCKFFSPVKTKVKYDDSVTIISQEGDWFMVSYKGVKGCIHKSAIQEKKFLLSEVLGSQEKGASGDEVSLAGKGFNPQVENSFKNKHPELDFRAVDRIEDYKVSEDNLRNFMINGGLNLPQ